MQKLSAVRAAFNRSRNFQIVVCSEGLGVYFLQDYPLPIFFRILEVIDEIR